MRVFESPNRTTPSARARYPRGRPQFDEVSTPPIDRGASDSAATSSRVIRIPRRCQVGVRRATRLGSRYGPRRRACQFGSSCRSVVPTSTGWGPSAGSPGWKSGSTATWRDSSRSGPRTRWQRRWRRCCSSRSTRAGRWTRRHHESRHPIGSRSATGNGEAKPALRNRTAPSLKSPISNRRGR